MIRSPRILSWRWGRVVVETVPGFFKDAVLFPGGAHAWDWRASRTGHRAGIQPGAVDELIDRGARTVVLSTGVFGALGVAPETVAILERNGLTMHVLRTPDAVKCYNDLATTEPVGALIHSTC